MPIRHVVTTPVHRVMAKLGYDLVRRADQPAKVPPPIPADFDRIMAEIVEKTRPYTLTPPDRVGALVLAVRYLEERGIAGPIVECGTWRGGSLMVAALTLRSLGRDDRDLFGFDSFGLMPPPSDLDVDVFGKPARELFEGPGSLHLVPEMNNVPPDQVSANIRSTGYPPERIHLVQGMIEETIPNSAPERIALLRLDTDWYESTRHEMEHLFPRIVPGGVLLVDDYGLFRGAKKAVDEYLAAHHIHLLLTRTDLAGRMAVVG